MQEPGEYFNLPRNRHAGYLGLSRQFGVTDVLCSVVALDDPLKIIVAGGSGKPHGGCRPGIAPVIAGDRGIGHDLYTLGEIPDCIEPDGEAAVKRRKRRSAE